MDLTHQQPDDPGTLPHRHAPRGAATPAGVTAEIAAKGRCLAPGGSLTPLFFSEDPVDLARARAICMTCPVRTTCFVQAARRAEAYGMWGGRLFLDGAVVRLQRRRGRPRKAARTTVDEITGIATAS
jgi:WhiB family redox-sensing transcriptional regulator